MNNAIMLCSIFLTTSVQACWLYDYWFPGSKTLESTSSSLSTSNTYMERFSSSSSSYSKLPPPSPPVNNSYSAKPSEQTHWSFAESQQSLPTYSHKLQQTIVTTDSSRDISTGDDDSIYDQDTSSTNRLMPSFHRQRDFPKPDLNCIIFNDSICSITCNQLCLLYNFESTGICTEHKTCYCTIVGMKSPAMSLNQYVNQSLDDLWFYKFVKSSLSDKILNKIKKHPTMSSKVLEMLRKPLRTGDDVKNRLSAIYPKWMMLHNLKSRRKAPINRFIDDEYILDEPGLEKRIKKMSKKYRKDITKQFSSYDYLVHLKRFLDSTEDETQLEHIFKQIQETKVELLIEYTKRYLQQRDLDFSKEDVESDECDCVDVEYIDNIVAGTLINQFLGMISTVTNFSNSAVNNTGYTTDEPYINSDQCSCPNKSTTKDVDDDSRWELPGFDQIMMKDYCGKVQEVWDTADYHVSYERGFSGSIRLEWRKGTDSVYIYVYSSGSIIQEWRFGEAFITLYVASNGSVTQSWELGDVCYSFKKWPSGSIERKWKDNNINQNVLAKYQGYISSWCAKNYFLMENWHCVIY